MNTPSPEQHPGSEIHGEPTAEELVQELQDVLTMPVHLEGEAAEKLLDFIRSQQSQRQ